MVSGGGMWENGRGEWEGRNMYGWKLNIKCCEMSLCIFF